MVPQTTGTRRVSAAAWLFVWLLLADVAVRASSGFVFSSRFSREAWQHATEQLMLAHPQRPPVISFFGSSRVRDDVAPYRLEDALSLPRGSVLNLGISAGRPSNALEMYRRHRSLLARNSVVVFAAEEWQFNGAWASATDLQFKAHATFRDRIDYPVRSKVPDLVLGYAWRLWDLHSDLRRVAGTAILGGNPRLPQLARDALGRAAAPADQLMGGMSAADPANDAIAARGFLNGYVNWRYEIDALGTLARLVREDGHRLVVVRLPLRSSYLRAAAEIDPDSKWWRTVQASIREADFADWSNPAAVGVADADFADYGHLSAAGAERFTRFLAQWTHQRMTAGSV